MLAAQQILTKSVQNLRLPGVRWHMQSFELRRCAVLQTCPSADIYQTYIRGLWYFQLARSVASNRRSLRQKNISALQPSFSRSFHSKHLHLFNLHCAMACHSSIEESTPETAVPSSTFVLLKPTMTLSFFRKRALRRKNPLTSAHSREKSIHQVLSKLQSAYSVFLPKPEEFFPLFQIIVIDPDRPRSPRSTSMNLRKIFERIQPTDTNGLDAAVIRQFLAEFTKVSSRTATEPTLFDLVLEKSLVVAGLEMHTQTSRVGITASRSRSTTIMRKLRWSPISVNSYDGRGELARLLWKYAEAIFILILQHLTTELQPFQGERFLLGIVTRTIVSRIGLSKAKVKHANGQAAAAVCGVGLGGCYGDRASKQVYYDLQGVSGLHFILFPAECIERCKWRVYRGIGVNDSELGIDDSQDVLRRNSFYQRMRWFRGEDIFHDTSSSSMEDDVKDLTWEELKI